MDAEYDMTAFPPFAVTVDLVALTIRDERLCVLLVERGEEPHKGSWALPGGFVQRGTGKAQENLDEAAQREFEEETGLPLQAAYLAQLGAYGDPGRDPRGNVVTVAYLVIAPSPGEPHGGGDASEASWLPVDDVLDESLGVAFDHKRIIADGVERTRELMETSAVATAFCGERFTVPYLRRVYEIVWDLPPDTLDPSNFHNRVVGMPGLIEPLAAGERKSSRAEGSVPLTVDLTSAARGRPPRFFKAGPLVRHAGPVARLEKPIERPWPSTRERPVVAPGMWAPAADAAASGEPPRAFGSRPQGLRPADWAALKQGVKSALWERARAGEGIHYGELASLVGLHWFSGDFFAVLDSVCIDEVTAGGPMVTALARNKRTGMPGDRFFILAKWLGRDVTDPRKFVDVERQRVFEWARAHPERA